MTGSQSEGKLRERTCLLTGGAGFIGCALTRRIADRFDRLIVVDALHPQVHVEPVRPKDLDSTAIFYHADITDPGVWHRILDRYSPDVVVHLAAETGTAQSLTEATRHAHVNVVGTTCMLDAFAKSGKIPSRIVLTSSRAVYGEGPWQHVKEGKTIYPAQRSKAQLERGEWDFPEMRPQPVEAGKTTPMPVSVYGATKLAQEHILMCWSVSFGVKAVILRLQNVYGPGQSLNNVYTGIVSLFVQLAREGKSIPIYEDGNIVRDLIFIDDVADVLTLACLADFPSEIPYDIGSGRSTKLLDLANMIATRYGSPLPIVSGKFQHGDVRHASCKLRRSTELLTWSPQWSLEQGLTALMAWVEKSSEAGRPMYERVVQGSLED
jgi:dTDP-L-rhamnose 4-epimerase